MQKLIGVLCLVLANVIWVHLLMNPFRATAAEQTVWVVVVIFLSLFPVLLLFELFILALVLKRKFMVLRKAVLLHRSKQAISRMSRSAPRALPESDATKVRSLLSQGDDDGLRLAMVALDSLGPSNADIAAIFTPHVLQTLAQKIGPQGWPLVVQRCTLAIPCVRVFAAFVEQRLAASRKEAFADTGFMGHVQPNMAWQEPYKVLLEHEFPKDFIAPLAAMIREHIAMRDSNCNGPASYYVYAFPFESLTTLSKEGARILAELPAEGTYASDPYFWNSYGKYLALTRISELSDDAADALGDAKRNILFGNLRSFPDTSGHIKLARRLAAQSHVILGPSPQLAPEISRILSATTVAPPTAIHDILVCEVKTVQDRNRADWVSWSGDVPNILQ